MQFPFARSYVERLLSETDAYELHRVISVVGAQVALPDEFWLFQRLIEWESSTRSGVWQHYESLSEAACERMYRGLNQHGLSQLARQYRMGWEIWEHPYKISHLDKWLDSHMQEIHTTAIALIAGKVGILCAPP